MNLTVHTGRMTRDPELRHTQTGTPVASFAMAVDRPQGKDKEKETDFIDFIAWRNDAEFVSKYFVKGMKALVTGRLQIRDWTDKEGNKRRSAEIVTSKIEFCESKKQGGDTGGYRTPTAGSDFAEITEDDGDLPF